MILLKFTETPSNLTAAQAAKTTLKPLSPVAPFIWILTHFPDENQSKWKTTMWDEHDLGHIG